MSRLSIEASGLSSRTKMRRPLWTLAAASLRRSTLTIRARTSSPSTIGLKRHQHVRPFLEQVAELVQPLLEDDRLVLPGRVGELHDAHLRPALGAALGPVEHARAQARGRGAGAHRAGEIGPAGGAKALQRRIVGLQRMAGEEEADGVELALELLGLRPRARVDFQRRRLRIAEQGVLARRLFRGARVGDRQHRLDRGEDHGPVRLERRRTRRPRRGFRAPSC